MLGLIFAVLYAAFAIVVNDVQLIAAAESTLGFLWYWHVVFAVLITVILLLVPLGGSILMLGGDNAKDKGIGVAVLLSSPFIFLLGALGPALFLGAVYAVDSGIQGGEIVNQNHVIVGGVLYGVAILSQITHRSFKSTASKS